MTMFAEEFYKKYDGESVKINGVASLEIDASKKYINTTGIVCGLCQFACCVKIKFNDEYPYFYNPKYLTFIEPKVDNTPLPLPG